MISAVVFDLDDTLYPEVDYCRSGMLAVAEVLSRQADRPSREIFAALWREFEGGNRQQTFNPILDQLGLDSSERAIRDLIRVYRNHTPGISLPPASRKVLTQMKNMLPLGLLTDGFLPAQRLKVRALKIGRFFKSIVYTEQLGRKFWKPSPAGFERLIESLGVPAEEMAYVGDNPAKDFVAPNQLGMVSIQVQNAQAIHSQVSPSPENQAQHQIDQIESLTPLIKELNSKSTTVSQSE